MRSNKLSKVERCYRYSDANTHTERLTLAEARRFQRLQNGGTISLMDTLGDTGHTPGPWHRNIPPASKYTVIFAGRNTYVARVVPDGMAPEEVEANCNLIAAAPELLDALRVLTDHAQEQYPHFESERGQADIKAALDAIAKAERTAER